MLSVLGVCGQEGLYLVLDEPVNSILSLKDMPRRKSCIWKRKREKKENRAREQVRERALTRGI